jgi:DNA replication protein DnaC
VSEIERLHSQLQRLRLHTFANMFEDEANKAAKVGISYTAFLSRLVDEEIAAKVDRSINARTAKAHFPMIRTLEQFDFPFQPSLSAARIRELAELGFIGRAENLVLVGRPGVGKTHLAVAIGVRACQARKRVLFTSANDLLDDLLAAEVSRRLAKFIETTGKLNLLIIDELGYTPMDGHRANLLFQLVSHLYTRVSMIVTSNLAFDAWGGLFGGDEVIASAILDRLLHHSHVFLIAGPSYRMKGKAAQGLEETGGSGQDMP